MRFLERSPGVRMRLVVCALALAAGTTATAVVGARASSPTETVILYQDAASSDGALAVPVQLWTTDGNGQHAKRILVLPPTSEQRFLGARLGAGGGVVYAVRQASQVSNIYLLGRGAQRGRLLFSVRGLILFAPSPDGRQIAYTRDLPVAGKPLLVVVHLDGSLPSVVAPVDSHTLSWSGDGKTLFLYGVQESSVCWFCAISVSTRKMRAILFDDHNMQGWPSVAPDGQRFAFWNLKGPAGERIYTTTGKILRNIVGVGGNVAVWSPDETRLILQLPGSRVFDFSARVVQPFRHSGPAGLRIVDWARTAS